MFKLTLDFRRQC